MAEEKNEVQPDIQSAKQSSAAGQEVDPVVRERVEELSWLLLDEQISDDEMQLFESLLLSDDGARQTYLDCVQLHTDLMFEFRKPAVATASATSPVLGFLGEGLAAPPSEDVRA